MKPELLTTNHGHLPSRTLIYINTRRDVSNLWMQPIDGGAPKQLINWQSEMILAFDWSRNGKQLAIARGLSDQRRNSDQQFQMK